MSGPKKLHILTFKEPDYSDSPGPPYVVRVNPEKYSHNYSVSYNQTASIGSNAPTPKLECMPPQTIRFELLFDATGVIENSPTDLEDEIKNFRKAVYSYEGDIHSPYYLQLYWGTFSFNARLTELTLNYTLFKANGAPLRARADVSFIRHIAPKTAEEEAHKESPDITHVVQVRAGDRLPLMTYRVYGDTRYYLDVARHNGLVDIRNLKPGMKLAFPPLN